MKILVAVPIGKRDYPEPEMCRGVTDLLLHAPDLEVGNVLWGYRDLGGAGAVALQREFAANAVRATVSWSHLLFLDSDIYAPVDTIRRLVKAGRPVMVATYPTDEAFPMPAAFVTRPDGDHPHLARGVQEIAWAGLGCALIQREVFERVSAPWFAAFTEDRHFYTKCREAGYTIWCDYDALVGHPHKMWRTLAHCWETAKVERQLIVPN